MGSLAGLLLAAPEVTTVAGLDERASERMLLVEDHVVENSAWNCATVAVREEVRLEVLRCSRREREQGDGADVVEKDRVCRPPLELCTFGVERLDLTDEFLMRVAWDFGLDTRVVSEDVRTGVHDVGHLASFVG